MRKSLVITLALVFVLGIAGTAFAAANPFVDVPAKHWAYDSVAKLAKAGIITGYGDGTFRGDRTMTRYEMAAIVAKAMANQDKANAEQKAEISKLEAEFSDELTKLGVRVSALENKVGNIKFTGDVRERYEWTKEPVNNGANSPAEKTRLHLDMNAQLTDDLAFVGRYTAESATGGGSASSQLTQAYLSGKSFALGRLPVVLGKGLVYDSNKLDTIQDGISVTVGDQVKLTGMAFKAGQSVIGNTGSTGSQNNNPFADKNIYAANIDWTVNKDFDFTAVYAKTKDDILGDPALKTWAVGFGYNGIQNVGLTFEYGKNSSDSAKYYNNGSDSKAWMAKAKYLGADGAKPQSYGIWVGYRKADPGFFSNSALDGTDAMPVSYLNDVKGWEYGVDYTVFKNGVLALQYNHLKDSSGNTNGNNFIAQLTYSF